MAVKAGAAVLGLAVAAALAPVAPGRLAPRARSSRCPAAAFLVPDARLRRRIRARARTIDAELADVLDLLRVAIAAGLSPKRALAEVGRRHPGTLAAELRRAAATAALGVPAATALADLERRSPAAGVPALVAALAASRAPRRAARPGAGGSGHPRPRGGGAADRWSAPRRPRRRSSSSSRCCSCRR